MNTIQSYLYPSLFGKNMQLFDKYMQIIFYSSSIIFLLFLHKNITQNIWIFWVCIFILTLCLVFQIIYAHSQPVHILIQLLLFRYLLQMVFVIPVEGLFGYDTMPYLKSAELFNQYGFDTPWHVDPLGFANSINSWPGLSILSLVLRNMTNINLFLIAKYVPSIISSFGILFIYLISKKISKSDQIALLSTFASLSTLEYVEFHSWFVRESLAFVYFLIAIYLTVNKLILKSKVEYSILYLFVLGSIVISHHFISLVLMMYISCVLLSYSIYTKLPQKKTNFYTIFSLTVIFILSYWIYVGIMPFVLSVDFLKDILNQSLTFQLSNELGGVTYANNWSLRRFILMNGNIFFVILFGLFSIYSLILKPNKNKIIFIEYAFCLFLIFLVSVVFPNYILIVSNRIYMYAWPIVFVMAFDVFNIANIQLKYLLIFFSFLFVIFNIWSIAPYIYSDTNHPEYEFNQVDFRQSNIHYSSINWIDRSYNLQLEDIIIGSSTAKDLIEPMLKIKVLSDSDLLKEGKKTTPFKLLYFDKEMFDIVRAGRDLPYKVSPYVYKSFNSKTELIKNYNNGKIEIYSNYLIK